MIKQDSDRPLPERLYKYREPDIEILKYILIDNELWAARPSTFNDPFDCFPYVDQSGTYDEALAYIDLRIARTGSVVTRENRRKLARQIHKKGLGSLDPEASKDAWQQSVDQFGIISLSEECTNILMWSHYAKNHTGVCLEFGTELPPIMVVAPVSYQARRPKFRPLETDRSNLMERLLLHKADIWSYEREWRHFRIKEGAGKTPFPPSALKSVIVGAAVTETFERALRDLIATRSVQIQIRRAHFDTKDFRLRID